MSNTNHATNAAERLFAQCPALDALRRTAEPKPEHVRACLLEFAQVFERDKKTAIDAATADITHSRDMYKQQFCKALDAVDAVFQIDSTKPPPLLPNFCKLGESKFEAVIRLAKAYIEKDAATAELTKDRDHWKANHDEMVARNHLLRAAAWQNTKQPSVIAQALASIDEADRLRKEVAELRAENEALKEQVEQWKNSCRELMRQREH